MSWWEKLKGRLKRSNKGARAVLARQFRDELVSLSVS